MLRPHVIRPPTPFATPRINRLARFNSYRVALRHSPGVIQFPARRIVPNVPPDTIEIRATANDSIVIIALPNLPYMAAAGGIDTCRDRRLERSHNGAERPRADSRDGVSTRGAWIEEQDPMKMVRHDYELVCVNVWEMFRKIRPTVARDFAVLAQNHPAVPHTTKKV